MHSHTRERIFIIMSNVKAIILAGGSGKRLGGDAPKPLAIAGGKPLLAHVLNALDFIPRDDVIIVVGYKKELIMEAFPDCVYVVQEQQLGTGHAVGCAEPMLSDFNGHVLVCCGDMPMISRATYEALLTHHLAAGNDCTVLSGSVENPFGYGRIKRSDSGEFDAIVEEKDCTPTEREITEINAGIYIFRAQQLLTALGSLHNNNAQSEYYLTDAPKIIAQRGGAVGVLLRELGDELLGVSTPDDLARIDALLKAD